MTTGYLPGSRTSGHPSNTKANMLYSEDQAANYDSITLEGSTYAVSLLPAISSIGDLAGMAVLDFGTGTGRSARALKDSGASRVVAVDNNENMLKAAPQYPGVAYLRIGRTLPIKERSMGAALCANVLSEFNSTEDMVSVFRQVREVLDMGRFFVIVVPNPDSIDCDYVSYRYIDVVKPKSGSPMSCLLKGERQTLIQDYYWTTGDYVSALETAGFKIDELLLPIADKGTGDWLDETRVAPDLVIRSKRIG
jgi:toxoflavin synthase